jgi:hypothetical protein
VGRRIPVWPGSWKGGNELLVSIIEGEYLDLFSNKKLLKKESALPIISFLRRSLIF